jgi:hypothetical protein
VNPFNEEDIKINIQAISYNAQEERLEGVPPSLK